MATHPRVARRGCFSTGSPRIPILSIGSALYGLAFLEASCDQSIESVFQYSHRQIYSYFFGEWLPVVWLLLSS